MTNLTDSVTGVELISTTTWGVLSLLLKFIVNPVLGAAGIFSNTINLVVFYKVGLTDGVSQNFFILSISDGMFAAIAFVNSLGYILQETVYSGVGGQELQVQRVYWASFFASTFPQTVSMIVTVVIAVVRCCCVAMPLRVKYLITAPRQLAAILVSCGATTAVLLYVFTPMKTIYMLNPRTDRRVAVLVGYRWSTYAVFSSVVFYASFTIIIACVLILSVSLKRSSKFRESSTGGNSGSDSESRRDARVVKTVVFVSIVYICCVSPHLVFSVVKVFTPGFSPQGPYRQINQLFLMFSEASLLLNVNINIVVYVLFNTRYRVSLLALLGRNLEPGKSEKA